jgi:hypothetical protein
MCVSQTAMLVSLRSGARSMSASQRVSRGFRRLAPFLAVALLALIAVGYWYVYGRQRELIWVTGFELDTPGTDLHQPATPSGDSPGKVINWSEISPPLRACSGVSFPHEPMLTRRERPCAFRYWMRKVRLPPGFTRSPKPLSTSSQSIWSRLGEPMPSMRSPERPRAVPDSL